MRQKQRKQQQQQQQQNKSKQVNTKRSRKLVAAIMVTVCLLLMIGFAWYYYLTHRKVLSEERDVMPPYYLYLVDANGTDKLQLTVGNLHPGETKQIVFGVSNQAPEGDREASYKIGKDSQFNYELELAYTQNLPVEYKVYELTKVENGTSDEGSGTSNGNTVTVEWTDKSNNTVSQSFKKPESALVPIGNSNTISETNNSEMYGDKVKTTVNLGKYDLYNKNSGAAFDLTTKVENDKVTFDLDYYMIEIQWKDGIQFSDYLKETDLVYVIVNAMQLEPEETTTAVSE